MVKEVRQEIVILCRTPPVNVVVLNEFATGETCLLAKLSHRFVVACRFGSHFLWGLSNLADVSVLLVMSSV